MICSQNKQQDESQAAKNDAQLLWRSVAAAMTLGSEDSLFEERCKFLVLSGVTHFIISSFSTELFD